ncbi:MAG: prepilin-type N-terminal cleavage/methylation domain-containing protein [Candidatus Omnitrophica bacterium]|nr:prepilin-type N-terminal cleavage/methylation domain-containing protein [Candidatus Omnitrophota bacterium]
MPRYSNRLRAIGERQRLRAPRGLTLLECLISILVLAVAVFTFVSNLTHLVVLIRQNKMALLAKTAVQREMERRESQGFFTISALCLSNPNAFAPTADGISPIPGATGQILVCDYDPATGNCSGCGTSAIKKLTVTVSLGPSRVYRLTSLFSDWTAGLASATNSYYPPS